MKILRSTLTTGLLCAAAWAQSPAAQKPAHPDFEVASVRPAGPIDQGVTVGVHIDGAQVRWNSMALKDMVRIAYQVKDFQVAGPEWIAAERYDIAATIPKGVTRDDFPEMLQRLLADRFQMKVHREQRELPVYALVITKGGLKAQESPADGSPAPDPSKDAVNVTASGSAAGVMVMRGKDSYFSFGDNKLEIKKLTFAEMCDTLSRFTDKPVVDMTGTTARYDMTLSLTAEDYRAMLIRSAVAAGVSLPPQALQLIEMSSGDSLATALQLQGLKMESRKAPIETVVVDRALKTPTEN